MYKTYANSTHSWRSWRGQMLQVGRAAQRTAQVYCGSINEAFRQLLRKS
ncbi:MAG: hypothetical protein PUP91_22890 [Rhizonema sp. PD37]|nr:hypothetical protein [Rhizonema sp. PD37]